MDREVDDLVQLFGLIALGFGLYLLVELIRLFKLGRWKEGAICIGSTLFTYVVCQASLPVILSPLLLKSISFALVLSQLVLIFSYAIGFWTIGFFDRAFLQAPAPPPPTPPAPMPPRVPRESKLAGAKQRCPDCGLEWVAPPDDCPKCTPPISWIDR